MSTTSALITGAKVPPSIDNRPDIKNMTKLCEKNEFRVSNVLVNAKELSNHPMRKVYKSKSEYRETFINFLSNSPENFLIYYYCGHGNQQKSEGNGTNAECLCIMQDSKEWYKDEELTQDIDEYLPFGKTLYVILDACHSGGMINAWQLDTRLEKSVVFFCGANSEILAWDDKREDAVGGLFTNSFCLHAEVGRPLWEIADKVLVEMFTPYQKNARSPSVRYSRPAVAAEKFCELSPDGYILTKGTVGISKPTGVMLFLTILDADCDHRIKRSDFENSVSKKLVEARNPDAVKRLREWVIKMCDATGLVGDVSYSYESYRTHLQSQLNNPEVKQAFHEIFVAHFDYLDAEGRGYITLKEYRIFMAALGCTDENEIAAGFKNYDSSGDGKINRKEWIESLLASLYSSDESMAGSRCIFVAKKVSITVVKCSIM